MNVFNNENVVFSINMPLLCILQIHCDVFTCCGSAVARHDSCDPLAVRRRNLLQDVFFAKTATRKLSESHHRD